MLYLVMGVTGCGKSTLGSALAERLDLPFYDADAFHPAENRAKLGRNEPLDDADRRPWLAQIAELIPRWEARGGAVLACSALKQEYRAVLVRAAKSARIIFLDVAQEVILRRLCDRRGRHALVHDFDRLVAGQFRDLEPPADALVVSGQFALEEMIEGVFSALRAEGNVTPRQLRIARESTQTEPDTEEAIEALLSGLGTLRRVLLVPPDHTRIHSGAGELTAALYRRLTARGCHVEVLPAIGTHVAMTREAIARMYPGVPHEIFAAHDFKSGLELLGEVPGGFVKQVSGGRVDYAIRCEVNATLMRGSWDRIISIGQLVPHEVVGIANHNKNIFVGTGGKDIIDKTHFLGAVCNMETIMGARQSPVREVLNYMSSELGALLPPVTYLLTVRQRVEDQMVTRGLYAGDDEGCFFVGAKLARRVNIDVLDKPLRKVVVHLDREEFKSTWLGNKAVYRTRMALADGAELVVLAPGVDKLGEDPAIDRLIRRHGYRGTARVLESVARDPDLAGSLAAAAHLIHGSSEGRFEITYATGPGLTKDEVLAVGYGHEHYENAALRYDALTLKDGPNVLPDGEEIFYVSNPALGLWAYQRSTQ